MASSLLGLMVAGVPASAVPQGAAEAGGGGDIVVTGTSAGRRAFDMPGSATTVEAKKIQRNPGDSQADILATLPSVKVGSSGGEVGVNVFLRGLPLGGPFQLTPLQYDGIPVVSTSGLNPSADDVYVRNDSGIARLEFVRGGVSNLFGAGSVAGIINYISETGESVSVFNAQLGWEERGRVRGDVSARGPLGRDLYYAVSGFVRRDAGPIRTGLTTRGGQVRGNLRRDLADGSGAVTLFGQYIEDRAQFYVPFPLDGATRTRVAGNDGAPVASLLTDAAAGLSFARPGGRFRTQVADGVFTDGGQAALAFDKDLGGGWGVNGKGKYSRYAHRIGFFLDGDGVSNVPETQAGFLALRRLPGDARFTYADSGEAVAGDALLYANRVQDRIRPNHDATAELNLTRTLTHGAVRHLVTLGGYWANGWARDQTVTTGYLGTFENRPRLIDLVVRNAAGVPTIIAKGGLLDAGVGYTNGTAQQSHRALYLADQIEGARVVFDVGGRVEWTDGAITRAATATTITDATTPDLSNALRTVVWETGQGVRGTVRANSWALSAGALYRLVPGVNLYANASRGFYFPVLYSIAVDANGRTQSYQPEIIRQAEAGVKIAAGRVTGSLAAFANDLKNRRTVTLANAPGGGIVEQVTVVSTRAYGVEAVLGLRVATHLRVEGNASHVDHAFTALDVTPQFVGNREPRQPDWLYNAGAYYDDGAVDASIATTYTGAVYTDPSNSVRLDGFALVRAAAGYTRRVGAGQSLRIGVAAYNLLDSDAVSEASARLTPPIVGGYFIGRPVLPRRVSVTLGYRF